jgi:membrane-associated protease RseP (regulator of RpoE activity)
MVISNFVTYDLIFLALSIIFVAYFVYKRRERVARQGLLYIYRTRIGINFIEKFSKKYSKILKPLQYLILIVGYVLMIGIIYALIWTIYIYLKVPAGSAISKIPAIFPLIPYFNDILGIKNIFPIPFYFTYFIIAVGIVAVVHEFSHGIFARLNNIKIHSTGFAFLGPFIGAFVEQDEKQMNKAKIFPQLSILAAGVFANIITMIVFALLFLGFFALAFTPAGVYFTHSYSLVNTSEISSMDTVNFGNNTFLEIVSNNKTYFANIEAKQFIENKTYDYVPGFVSTPAFDSLVKGNILLEADGKRITSYSVYSNILSAKKPGDTINIKTLSKNVVYDYNITLSNVSGKAFLGLQQRSPELRGFVGNVIILMNWAENPAIYYTSNLGDFGLFIKYLFWWIIFINLAVALSNMIPAGIFDGGRFFMLSVQAATKSKKIAEKAYKVATWLVIAAVIILMLKWVFNVI